MESITTAAFHSALNLSPNQIIYATDNFFDLGGSSLTVAILARHLSERTNIEVSIIDIFEKKTAEAVAKFLDANKKGGRQTEGS
jgi:acyl carrier protein